MNKVKPNRAQVRDTPKWRRNLLWVPGLAVVAIAPWFVPWQDLTGGAAPQEAAPVVSAEPEASASAPDEKSVEDVVTAVKGAKGYDLPVSAEEAAQVDTKPGAYTKVGRIQIPGVGVDVSFGEGVYESALEKGPGHWPGTPLPGRTGNSVLSGHRNTHTQPFKELDRVKPGDEIIVTVGKNGPVTFTVDNTTIVPEAEYKEFVLAQPKDPDRREVTLFACHPEGNPIFRIVVRATANS